MVEGEEEVETLGEEEVESFRGNMVVESGNGMRVHIVRSKAEKTYSEPKHKIEIPQGDSDTMSSRL